MYGFPFPLVIWEKEGSSWIDFPNPAGILAFVFNPLFGMILLQSYGSIRYEINRRRNPRGDGQHVPPPDRPPGGR